MNVELSELPSETNSNQLTLSKAAFLQGNQSTGCVIFCTCNNLAICTVLCLSKGSLIVFYILSICDDFSQQICEVESIVKFVKLII